MKLIVFRFAVIAFLLIFNSALSQSVESVMEKYFNAIGGLPNVRRIHSSKVESISWLNMESTDSTTFLKPRETRNKITRKAPVFEYREVFNEGKLSSIFYYNDKENGNLTFDGIFTDGLWVEAPSQNVNVEINVTCDLLQMFNLRTLEYSGESEITGTSSYVLKGTKEYKPGLEFTSLYHFDKISGLLLARQPEDKLEVINFFKDYRFVQGINTPFHIEWKRNGILYGEERIISLEFNPNLENSIFYYR